MVVNPGAEGAENRGATRTASLMTGTGVSGALVLPKIAVRGLERSYGIGAARIQATLSDEDIEAAYRRVGVPMQNGV